MNKFLTENIYIKLEAKSIFFKKFNLQGYFRFQGLQTNASVHGDKKG